MKSRLLPIPLFLLFTLLCTGLLNSCSNEDKAAKDEGIIEFNTEATDPTHPLYGFAPASAIFKFKKDKFIIEMSTMGLFNTSIIGDLHSKTLAQTVKFMNLKQACIEKEQDLIDDNKDYQLIIEESKETKEIAGLKCHKVKVTKVNDPNVKFDVWYTKELGLENCNALNPYAKVKGVLMDYRIQKMGMELHFSAKSYQRVKVPDHAFVVPASMKIVSKEEMAKFFADLQ
ncbi:MAG TPA: hypothetical protein PLQ93_07275 [Bacteroidia bacterium]|nr:hypothetical protein [Bacteroidia bacterium]